MSSKIKIFDISFSTRFRWQKKKTRPFQVLYKSKLHITTLLIYNVIRKKLIYARKSKLKTKMLHIQKLKLISV